MKKGFLILSLCIPLIFFISCASLPNSEKTYEELKSFTLSCSNENSKELFDSAMKCIDEGDRKGFTSIIEKWSEESPKDADLYLARFIEQLGFCRNENNLWDKEKIDAPLSIINEAIALHPLRIDLYHQKALTYFLVHEYEKGVEVLDSLFDLIPLTQNKWLWSHNYIETHVDNKEECDIDFINFIHSFVFTLYEEGQTNLAVKLDKKLCKTFPTNYKAINAVAIDFYNVGLKEEAFEALEYAHKLSPNDLIIIGNLAALNGQEGRKEEFAKWVTLLKNSNDSYWVNYANELLQMYK